MTALHSKMHAEYQGSHAVACVASSSRKNAVFSAVLADPNTIEFGSYRFPVMIPHVKQHAASTHCSAANSTDHKPQDDSS